MPRSKLNILITAGPTREPIDPVRFLSNRSSGKMGCALAEAATVLGHQVTLVIGPITLSPPIVKHLYKIETARQLRDIVLREAKKADIIIMAAAVADYEATKISRIKIKKQSRELILRLKPTPDILHELGKRKKQNQLLVGFAAETSYLFDHAKKKLKTKNLDLIIANQIGRKNFGFESDYNQVTFIRSDGNHRKIQRMTKKRLARKLISILINSYRSKQSTPSH